jgi:flagellin FlaB
MFNWKRLHSNEQGQAALETAIILIAFVVVAAVFAFTILSAGNSSTDKGKAAINAGMQSVESSLAVKGAVIGKGTAGSNITSVVFTIAVSSSSAPIKMSDITFNYRDTSQSTNITASDITWDKLVTAGTTSPTDTLMAGEQVEVTVSTLNITSSTPFTIEVKPPVGAVLQINRTAPAAISTVNDLG